MAYIFLDVAYILAQPAKGFLYGQGPIGQTLQDTMCLASWTLNETRLHSLSRCQLACCALVAMYVLLVL